VADAILDEVRRHDAALIIVGIRQRSGFDRWIRGSVAMDVVNRAECSVLVTPLE
jgi:nucleotide-binding universal stress UspA family protein